MKSRIYLSRYLAIAFIFFTLIACNNPQPNTGEQANPVDSSGGVNVDSSRQLTDTAILTLADIRDFRKSDSIEVVFNESQQIYTLLRSAKSFNTSWERLQSNRKHSYPLKVIFYEASAVIISVDSTTRAEADTLLRLYKQIIKSAPPRIFGKRLIDTATFNIVSSKYLNFPAILACTGATPDIVKAREIFKYCADQSCVNPSPVINPCIPFQYVKDGCFARANKMTNIIETKFSICATKVFSYATAGNDKLAVKATKWGGCCVTWWYHVAPVIKVKRPVAGGTVEDAYVIDPGMFDEPVLLSTWLAAQANVACYQYAKVTSYSLQPASSYTPDGIPGAPPTGYTSDPGLVHTDQTCRNYKTKVTCP